MKMHFSAAPLRSVNIFFNHEKAIFPDPSGSANLEIMEMFLFFPEHPEVWTHQKSWKGSFFSRPRQKREQILR